MNNQEIIKILNKYKTSILETIKKKPMDFRVNRWNLLDGLY